MRRTTASMSKKRWQNKLLNNWSCQEETVSLFHFHRSHWESSIILLFIPISPIEAVSQTYLSEQSLSSPTIVRRKIDIDVVVFGVNGLLNERFVERNTVDLHNVISLHYLRIWSNKVCKLIEVQTYVIYTVYSAVDKITGHQIEQKVSQRGWGVWINRICVWEGGGGSKHSTHT